LGGDSFKIELNAKKAVFGRGKSRDRSHARHVIGSAGALQSGLEGVVCLLCSIYLPW
jgi:hypothetical protein